MLRTVTCFLLFEVQACCRIWKLTTSIMSISRCHVFIQRILSSQRNLCVICHLRKPFSLSHLQKSQASTTSTMVAKKAVIFDLGGVIVEQPQKALEKFGEKLKLPTWVIFIYLQVLYTTNQVLPEWVFNEHDMCECWWDSTQEIVKYTSDCHVQRKLYIQPGAAFQRWRVQFMTSSSIYS